MTTTCKLILQSKNKLHVVTGFPQNIQACLLACLLENSTSEQMWFTIWRKISHRSPVERFVFIFVGVTNDWTELQMEYKDQSVCHLCHQVEEKDRCYAPLHVSLSKPSAHCNMIKQRIVPTHFKNKIIVTHHSSPCIS